MPNFDSFERIFKSVMSSELSSEEGSLKIKALPDDEKVLLVKNRTQSEIKGFLDRAVASLQSFFPRGFRFSSSDDNRAGKDLLEEITQTSIELKSGPAMTDANVGLASIEWAIGDKNGSLSELVSKSVEARKLLLRTNASESEIARSKDKEMDEIYTLLKSLLSEGPAPDTLSHFVKCVSLGLTKGPEIQSSYNNLQSQISPLMLQADWEAGLREYEKKFEDGEVIEITKIERTSKRVQIVLQGNSSGRIAKIYPHHRNSWTDSDGTKYEANNWVSTGSCQVWIN